MSMVTQCPSCATTFRVTPQQLQAHHGMVRCGRCATVFDGFKALSTLRDETPPDAEAPDEVAASAIPPSSEWRADSAEGTAGGRGPLPAAASETWAESVPGASGNAPTTEETPARQHAGSAAAAVPEEPEFVPGRASGIRSRLARLIPTPEPLLDEPIPRTGGRGWRYGALVLFIALAAQGIYFFRSELAASVPELRPSLNRMCEFLQCIVALPQRPRLISIEASDMQATDPANPGRIALTTTLRNHATTEIGYPALDVVLTNTKEHTVARRIFLPEEYLATRSTAHAGIAPNAEVTIRLDIDTGNLGAAGFRLDLLAAP